MAQKQAREKDGRYDFMDNEIMCICGHKLGVHAALNETKRRPCFNEDKGIEHATGEGCNCKNFKKN